jgi:hypothetical protein
MADDLTGITNPLHLRVLAHGVHGGDGDPDPDPKPDPDPDPDPDPKPDADPDPDDPELGPKGEKALAEFKRRARDAEKEERLVKAEVKAAAAGKFANADLAVKVLDLDDFEVDDDGNVDQKKISSAIDDFIKENPEFAGKRRASGDGGGGPRGKPPAGASMNDLIRRAAGRS